MKKSSRLVLPEGFIAFILEHIDCFEARIQDDSIVISLKPDGEVKHLPSHTPSPVLSMKRPTFVYTITDRKLTPAQAARYGFSEQRLKVYQAIWDADPKQGIQAKDILATTKLPHGTVQQILHWLRTRQMINGEPER